MMSSQRCDSRMRSDFVIRAEAVGGGVVGAAAGLAVSRVGGAAIVVLV
jgi:hypothetical protein